MFWRRKSSNTTLNLNCQTKPEENNQISTIMKTNHGNKFIKGCNLEIFFIIAVGLLDYSILKGK